MLYGSRLAGRGEGEEQGVWGPLETAISQINREASLRQKWNINMYISVVHMS